MFFEISPVRPLIKRENVRPENESEKPEVLSLAPFSNNPKLFFEDVEVGMTVNRKLLIENPTNHDLNLFVTSRIPQELNVLLVPEQLTVNKKSSATLELVWNPLQEEFSRHIVTIEDGKRIRRDVPVAFKSVLPKKLKTNGKQGKKACSTFKKKSPGKLSPTKKYYASKPPYISPKRYASAQNKLSKRKYSPSSMKSPTSKCSINIHASPKAEYKEISRTACGREREMTYTVKNKENYPALLNASCNSSVFISPAKATFRLDYLQPTERRETYVVSCKKEKSLSESIFNDSLETASPEVSPSLEKDNSKTERIKQVQDRREPLGVSNQDNVSPNICYYVQHKLTEIPLNYDFEYKLRKMESFCFTPVSTPLKQSKESSPVFKATEPVNPIEMFTVENRTFELVPKSPNISTGTYVKSNISSETYVKGNASFETYAKSNVSAATFTKDSSVGDIANLTFSPISKTSTPPSSFKSNTDFGGQLNYDNANGVRNQPLSSIQEESIRDTDYNSSNRSFLKRKSDLNFTFTPSKKPYIRDPIKDWSKTGGTALRIAKKTSGLQFLHRGGEKDAVLIKQDTNQVVIQNPFLLAATNLADPFMTPHLFLDEEWLDQQQTDFKKWLNALLTPPEELSSEEHVVDVAKVWQECKKREVEDAPTKELVSSKYLTNNKLNSLRKAAQSFFKSTEMSSVLAKVVLAVETGKLAIREDKDIHLNLALKSEIMSMLLSYNPLWLRIGLETVYNEVIPLKSNSDVVGLSTFIANRVLKDPGLIKKHKTVHAPKYTADFKKFFLKKFFVLVYFLDQAKNKKLIPHDPCLFCKNSSIKESKEMLLRLAREMLAAVGDITKYLKYIGYVVTHVQTYLHEFDYAVKNLGVDLRDGIRLTRVMEIILMKQGLTSNLRVPAISRLQKIHNMKIVFSSLEEAGYKILYDISPKDIVDGHKEKTLSFLWQIVYKFQAPLMVKSATTIQSWFRSLPVVLKRRQLEKMRLQRHNAAKKIQFWYRRHKMAEQLCYFAQLLEKYLETVKMEKAAVKIQACYKMYRCRKLYKYRHSLVINIQRYARGWLVRNVNREHIKKAIIIQSYVRMYLTKQKYLRLRQAVTVIQARYHAKKQMETTRMSYVVQKSAAVVIQRWFRSITLMQEDKIAYEKLKTATLRIQSRFRANRLCKIERKRYLEIKTATLRIQAWYRSVVCMQVDRARFVTLKKSVLVVEERYLAVKAMRIQRSNYEGIKKASITIQRYYRAYQAMKQKRQAYLDLKNAAVSIQSRYRAKKLLEKERRRYLSLKSATVLIQGKYRAVKAMQVQRSSYIKLKEAAVKIQAWFRASLEMRKCLTYYVSLKYAVQILEDRYKAKKLMQKECSCYKKLKSAAVVVQRRYKALVSMRGARKEYLRLRNTTVFIQRKFRANKLGKIERMQYLKLKQAVAVTQTRYRALLVTKRCRNEYLKLRSAVITVQRLYRANRLMKATRNHYLSVLKYASIVQRRFRAKKAMLTQKEQYQKLRDTAVFIQQKWRAKKSGEACKKEFEELKSVVVAVQRRWRANKLCREEKSKYSVLRENVLIIQRRWMAKKLSERDRASYTTLRNTTVRLQQKWRAKSLKEKHRKEYLELKRATLFVQRTWRSVKLTERQRNQFLALRRTCTIVQQRWRANKLARTHRQNYLQLRNATVTIQRKWKAQKLSRYHKDRYVKLKKAAVTIQRRWRANKFARQEKATYDKLKAATITIQTRWRSKQLCEVERCKYLQLRQSALILQRRWRAKVEGSSCRQSYCSLKQAAVLIQTRWRANKLAKTERAAYVALRREVVKIQTLWRANKLARIQRHCYLSLKSATVVIQNRWRAQMIAKKQKTQYQSLKTAVLFVQRRWRAKKLRTEYVTLKKATVTLQAYWKMKQQRNKYLQLRKATVKLQETWRAKRLRDQQVTRYKSLKNATLVIQNRWRANKLAQVDKQMYKALKKAAVIVQARWRAKKQGAITRNNYLRMKQAAVFIQQKWRAQKLCERHRQRYNDLRKAAIFVQRKWRLKQVRSSYIALKEAAVTLQQRWRARAAMKTAVQKYTLLKRCVVTIQVWFKACVLMKQQRKLYVQARTSAIAIQRCYRGFQETKRLRSEFLIKTKTILELQRYVKGFLVRRKYARYFTQEEREKRQIERKRSAAIIKIQALWRGHKSRLLNESEIIAIRQRVKKATLKAKPQNTLGFRSKVALQALVSEDSTVFVVNKALEDFDYITRHSKNICVQAARLLPEQMYLMIKHTNRSLPEMTACLYSVNILINICKYPPTRPYSFIPEYVDNLVTIMIHWCDKEAQLFPSMCTLLWLFAHNHEWNSFIKSLPNLDQKFLKIQSQVLRKQSMVKRASVKGQTMFAPYKNLPLPSCEPDWGLTYKQNPYVFTNSIHAFSSLLEILNL